ncbi:MAG TPA: hypothetical protein VN048_03935 [Verrucomicrobiae bacterium]|jgi:hypothetical protein|nr:hypothetical protein [Verrucomicrobiae bacterium]
MEKKSSNWYVPPDILVHFALPLIAIISLLTVPLVSDLENGDALKIYFAGLGFAAVGTILLFIARLPLYRRGRFWTVGPRELDRTHRKLYWTAYLFVLAAFGLLAIAWLRTH